MSSPRQPRQADGEQPAPQAAQAGLAVAVADAIAQLWPSLDLGNLRTSLPAFKAAVAQQVIAHSQASATLAVRQYKAQRVAAGVRGAFTPIPADPPPVQQIAQTVDWAVQPLWNANVAAHAEAGGHSDNAAPERGAVAVLTEPKVDEPTVGEVPSAGSAIADAKARLAAASEKLVLDAGRDTVIDNVLADRKAKGWARIPEPDACSFCAMLATRGAVYRTEQTASFKTHDHCRCHVEPVFTAYEPSAQVRAWQQQYAEATRGVHGSKNLQIAFRRAYEGRTAPAKK